MASPEEQAPVGVSEAFGGKRTLKQLDADGNEVREWTISRLRAEDIGTFAEWVKDQREVDARKATSKARALAAVDRERIVAELRAKPVSWSDIYDHMVTPAGFRQQLLLSLRIAHPDATPADVDALEFEQGGIVGLVLWIFGIDGLPASPAHGPRQEDGSPPAEGVAIST